MNKISYSVGPTFGLENIPDEIKVEGFDIKGPFVPKKDENFRITRGLLSDILTYWREPYHGGLLLLGPTGCGKTSSPRFIAACLNIQVQQVTGHNRLELQDLLGHYVIIDGETVWQDGPLTVAAEQGHWFILDELDRMDPANAVALHGVLDANDIVLTDCGGRHVPIHPDFRFIATANTTGMGDDNATLYQSAQQQDIALLDRFMSVNVSYPDEDTERAILKAAVPDLSARLAEGMLKVANAIRGRFLSDGPDSLPVTMSTRTLLSWARAIKAYAGASKEVNVFRHALDRTLINRTPEYIKKALNEIVDQLASNLS